MLFPALVTLMMEAIRSSETSVVKDPHGLTFQKTAFWIILPHEKFEWGEGGFTQ
jgi:hypothetical protein